MAKKIDPDRYLMLRGGTYYYWRWVPDRVREMDGRGKLLRISLRTSDVVRARKQRDVFEQADNQLWGALVMGDAPDSARAAYQAAVRRAEALGFGYLEAGEIAEQPVDQIVQRVLSIMDDRTPQRTEAAILGIVDQPAVKVSDAFKIYLEEIVPHELVGKSKAQRTMWKKVKQRAVDNFIKVVADKDMDKSTREDAQKFYRHWMGRVAPKEGKSTHSASSGNRDVGNLRNLYREYWAHMGQHDRVNPFDRLAFSTKGRKSRPPFPVSWIKDTVMAPGALEAMNLEYRAVAFALIETGGRLSEICNQTTETIVLDHAVPHLKIEPRDDPDDPREIKTESSVRIVPLIGIAHEVFKLFPKGFPSLRNRESSLSTAMNKFFSRNKLFPTVKHSMYSFRHSFEDRMKEANVDEELRRMLMGHTIDRPKYGAGGSLEWRRDQLMRIVLPYDPAILTDGRGLLPKSRRLLEALQAPPLDDCKPAGS